MTLKLKKYYLVNLLDGYDAIIKRCRLIEQVSNNFSFIPRTQITINEDCLRYEQDLIKRQLWKKQCKDKKLELLSKFAQDLDSLSESGFVHGDINSTNVIYDGSKLNLIDLEPSFKQIKYGKKVVMSAVPLRSLNDLNHKRISSETDKIGFYLICNMLFEIPLSIGNLRDLIKKRRNGFEFLPIKESEFMKFSFIQIFDYFKKSI